MPRATQGYQPAPSVLVGSFQSPAVSSAPQSLVVADATFQSWSAVPKTPVVVPAVGWGAVSAPH